jgi:hypothetical protein
MSNASTMYMRVYLKVLLTNSSTNVGKDILKPIGNENLHVTDIGNGVKRSNICHIEKCHEKMFRHRKICECLWALERHDSG